jgi:hypothetical protein
MRLNFGNDTELYLLAEALGCEITDLYIAVATVGDRVDDVIRHIRKRHSALAEPHIESNDGVAIAA